jgi:LmbE family N-acetylglucosaminyl deacetylase
MFNPQRILVLAPHTDDGELGCGGSIARFCAEGKEVYYSAFCMCAKSLPPDTPSDTLEKECKKATASLGVPASNLILFDYEVRELPNSRQQILEEMLQMQKNIRPDLVFIPAAADIHQDHQVVYQEGMRAFRNVTTAGYELPWNNYSFRTNYFVSFNDDMLSKKVNALRLYISQSHRSYMQEEFIRSLATVRGLQSGSRYAEAFDLYRWIV